MGKKKKKKKKKKKSRNKQQNSQDPTALPVEVSAVCSDRPAVCIRNSTQSFGKTICVCVSVCVNVSIS